MVTRPRPIRSTTPGEEDTDRVFGNRRGPLPGAGNNQGAGQPDNRNRTSQGINNNSLLSSSASAEFSKPATDAARTDFQRGTEGGQTAEQQRAESERIARQRAAERAATGQTGVTAPDDDVQPAPTQSGPTPPRFQPTRDPDALTGATDRFADPRPTGNAYFDTFNSSSLDRIVAQDINLSVSGNTQQIIDRFITPTGELKSVATLLNDLGIPNTIIDSEGRQIIRDPITGLVGYYEEIPFAQTREVPILDEEGKPTGRFEEVPVLDANNNPVTITTPQFRQTADLDLQARFAEFETKTAVLEAGQELAQQELRAQSEDDRIRARMLFENKLATLRDQATLASQQRFAASQSGVEFDRNLYLTNLNNNAEERRAAIQREWQGLQNNIDRDISLYQFSADQALREGEFQLAQQRFGFERALSTAGFMLQSLQFVTDNPQMMALMREAGVFQNLSNLTGLDFGFLAGIGDQQAGSVLADADLPPLREWEQMPPDTQQDILFNLSMVLGVKRELIVREIERRAQGFGLATGTQLGRLRNPVGA